MLGGGADVDDDAMLSWLDFTPNNTKGAEVEIVYLDNKWAVNTVSPAL